MRRIQPQSKSQEESVSQEGIEEGRMGEREGKGRKGGRKGEERANCPCQTSTFRKPRPIGTHDVSIAASLEAVCKNCEKKGR